MEKKILEEKRKAAICTDLACPLYVYRPYRISAAGRNEPAERAESTSELQPICELVPPWPKIFVTAMGTVAI
jgi:hypothetical protein